MTLPAFLLGLLYALLIGSLFHVWRDGGAGRLVLYLVLSVAGAAAGQLLGGWQNWIFFAVGPLNLGLVTIGSVVFLGIGYWLSLVEIRGGDRGKREV
ncbi:MAG TPA: hypothetical protein VF784_09050 [Anaerolineales bacterium]